MKRVFVVRHVLRNRSAYTEHINSREATSMAEHHGLHLVYLER